MTTRRRALEANCARKFWVNAIELVKSLIMHLSKLRRIVLCVVSHVLIGFVRALFDRSIFLP